MIIEERASKQEDFKGAALISSKLKRILKRFGINPDRDIRKINAVACRPPKSEDPTPTQISCCKPRVWKEIDKFEPELILLLGGGAVQSFLEDRWVHGEVGGIYRWRGWKIPDRDTGAWVAPAYHTGFFHKDSSPAAEVVWERDLEQALNLLHVPKPKVVDEASGVRILTDREEIEDYLQALNCGMTDLIAFDWETTGLKPHRREQRLKSVAIAESRYDAVAFPLFKKNYQTLRRIFASRSIGKIAANMKFEDNWSNVKMKGPVNGWIWDTMVAAHCLDNRPGITGLKFQAYVQYGILDYDSHMSYLLKSTDEEKEKYGANSLNRIDEIDLEELLIYNGIDAMLEYRLAMDQMAAFGIEDIRRYMIQQGISTGEMKWQ